MMYGGPFWGWLGILLGGLILLLLLGGLVALVLLAMRSSSRRGAGGQAPASGDRALDVLRERYARGEIGKDEYERMRRDLAP